MTWLNIFLQEKNCEVEQRLNRGKGLEAEKQVKRQRNWLIDNSSNPKKEAMGLKNSNDIEIHLELKTKLGA